MLKKLSHKIHLNESGIKVICEDDKIGRVKHIGTEINFMSAMELITNLEKKLRHFNCRRIICMMIRIGGKIK